MQESDDLRSGADVVRREVRCIGAGGDVLSDRPEDSLVIIVVSLSCIDCLSGNEFYSAKNFFVEEKVIFAIIRGAVSPQPQIPFIPFFFDGKSSGMTEILKGHVFGILVGNALFIVRETFIPNQGLIPVLDIPDSLPVRTEVKTLHLDVAVQADVSAEDILFPESVYTSCAGIIPPCVFSSLRKRIFLFTAGKEKNAEE